MLWPNPVSQHAHTVVHNDKSHPCRCKITFYLQVCRHQAQPWDYKTECQRDVRTCDSCHVFILRLHVCICIKCFCLSRIVSVWNVDFKARGCVVWRLRFTLTAPQGPKGQSRSGYCRPTVLVIQLIIWLISIALCMYSGLLSTWVRTHRLDFQLGHNVFVLALYKPKGTVRGVDSISNLSDFFGSGSWK